jgi:hypothetical protein
LPNSLEPLKSEKSVRPSPARNAQHRSKHDTVC